MNKNIEELPQMQETLEDLVKTLNANDSWDLYRIGIKLREKSVWLEELTKKTNECWELQKELKQLKKQKDDAIEYIHIILRDIFENKEYPLRQNDLEHILRMLGEIDDK